MDRFQMNVCHYVSYSLNYFKKRLCGVGSSYEHGFGFLMPEVLPRVLEARFYKSLVRFQCPVWSGAGGRPFRPDGAEKATLPCTILFRLAWNAQLLAQ